MYDCNMIGQLHTYIDELRDSPNYALGLEERDPTLLMHELLAEIDIEIRRLKVASGEWVSEIQNSHLTSS